MNEKKQSLISKTAKIVFIIVAVSFLMFNLFLTPVLALFICLTVAIATVLVLIVLKFFGDYEEEKEEEAYENCICDVTGLDDIKRVVNLPLPFVVVDDEHKIIVFNNRFRSLFKSDITGVNIEKLLGSFDEHVNKQASTIGDSNFDMYCSKIVDESNGKIVYSICLVDISEREKMKKQMECHRTAVGLIFIDNYDEVVEIKDDSQISLLTAMIDKKLGNYISEFGGILKKFEKDRYLFAMSVGSLEKAKEKKFDILNTIKETNAGNHIPVTLSVGIGISYETLECGMKSARDAIDLALGRGGDQVLIKDGERYLIYGGKSSEVSHNARIRARVKADALEGLMMDADTVFVMGHKIPDFDSIGSAIGIYRIAKALGKKCFIVLDAPSRGIETLYDELKKCSEYSDMFITEHEALEKTADRVLLVVVDTYIPTLVESREVLDRIKKVVVFDHHRKSTDYIEKAVLTYHEPYASSTSELVTEVIRHIGERVSIKPLEADALLAGITVDTKGFGIKAGAITFEAAAYLRRNGADTARVKSLFKSDLDEVKVKAITVGNAQMYKSGIIISVCPYDKDGANIISAQAADELLNIIGVRAAAVLCLMDGRVFISSRSYGDINVQMLLEKIGGGGHQTMAGAQFENITIEEAEEKLKAAIDEYLKEEN